MALVTGWTANTTENIYYSTANADDGYVAFNSTFYANNYLYAGVDAAPLPRHAGIRFINIVANPSINVDAAHLVLVGSDGSGVAEGCQLIIQGEQNIAPAQFSTYTDFIGRNKTTASVEWNNVPAWANGTSYQSPDIATIIDEIVGLSSWASGNNMVIFVSDNGSSNSAVRSSWAFDKGTAIPQLHIELPNIWQATLTTEPTNVWFNTTKGTEESAVANLDAAYEWYWTANVLYVYSTSDPDTAYVSPGIGTDAPIDVLFFGTEL